MKIALDATGGDHAPSEVIAGACSTVAQQLLKPEELCLVGAADVVAAELEQICPSYSCDPTSFEVVDAPENIEMDEHPAMALRKKRKSSIVVGSKLLRDGHVQAFVSAGNTGAVVGAGALVVKMLPGVRRPGIAATFAASGGSVTLIDVGANIHCQPEDLYAYARMGSEYRSGVDGIDRPRIGLLSIGEEDAKGGPLIQETRALLSSSDLNFTGNVEGQDVFSGKCDVIVCEGFVGNVLLKVSEGLGRFLGEIIASEAKSHADGAEGKLWSEVGKSLLQKTDYAEYGGAPLLGVNGLIVICHGRSDRRAIANALRVSKLFIHADVNQRIMEGLVQSDPVESSGGSAPGGSE